MKTKVIIELDSEKDRIDIICGNKTVRLFTKQNAKNLIADIFDEAGFKTPEPRGRPKLVTQFDDDWYCVRCHHSSDSCQCPLPEDIKLADAERVKDWLRTGELQNKPTGELRNRPVIRRRGKL